MGNDDIANAQPIPVPCNVEVRQTVYVEWRCPNCGVDATDLGGNIARTLFNNGQVHGQCTKCKHPLLLSKSAIKSYSAMSRPVSNKAKKLLGKN